MKKGKAMKTVNTARTATPPREGPDALRPWDATYDRSNDPRYSKEAAIAKYGDPRERPFTKFAAGIVRGHNALGAGVCPTCQNEIKGFRNEISQKEFSISGMCQDCQDSVFGKD